MVRHVEKTLRGRQILRGVDLEVPPGRLTVIEGGNGAGKTTLIRLCATIVQPDAGNVVIDGYDVRGAAGQVRKSIGLVLVNERSLYWRVSPVENLAVFGRLRGLPAGVIRERTSSLLEELELAHLANERVGRLSTGQRQRLMIARALLADAPVLLIDEPLRGLDEDGVVVVLELLARRAREGAAVLVAAPLVGDLVPLAHAHVRLLDGVLAPAADLPAPAGAAST